MYTWRTERIIRRLIELNGECELIADQLNWDQFNADQLGSTRINSRAGINWDQLARINADQLQLQMTVKMTFWPELNECQNGKIEHINESAYLPKWNAAG
jgi:hypothetical protein